MLVELERSDIKKCFDLLGKQDCLWRVFFTEFHILLRDVLAERLRNFTSFHRHFIQTFG